MKVLHLPFSVGGNSWGLAKGERILGLNSDVLIRSSDWLNYPYDINLNLQKESSIIRKARILLSTYFNIKNQYDVFHFNYGSSLIHSLSYHLIHTELPFYPKGTKLFATYNGCDARQKYATIKRAKISACHSSDCYSGMCNLGKMDLLRAKSIKKMSRYVKHIWALNPDLLYFLPDKISSFLPYSLDIEDFPYTPPRNGKKVQILHAPTNRIAKGTNYLFSAIDRLKETHSDYFEFIIVENQPHSKAIKLFESADLVIDQLVIGWYGGLAVEVMKMGKPVIARIASEDLKFIPKEMAIDVMNSIISADIFDIYDVIKECIENRKRLMEYSEAAVEYVNKWHNPTYVASITKEKYESE